MIKIAVKNWLELVVRQSLEWLTVRILPLLRRRRYAEGALHFGYPAHQPYHMTRILRQYGYPADFLAIGAKSPLWQKYDFHFEYQGWTTLIREFILFWRVVSRYPVIHAHCAVMLSESGWELSLLKRLGSRIVIHYRGCEARDRERNMALHPVVNICQDCDYQATICRQAAHRRRLASNYGDLFLVTTPDMLDFVPNGVHFPFFAPETPDNAGSSERVAGDGSRPFRIVHVTNHPGIEGTAEIRAAIEQVRARGYQIEFKHLRGVTHDEVLRVHATADLSIGKMKMGYYANAQIESLSYGVPAITWVRPEFITAEIAASGLILSDLEQLAETIEFYLTHPEKLAEKRARARRSILKLHDNRRLAEQLIGYYRDLAERAD